MTPLDDVRAHVQSRLPSAAPVTLPFDRAAGLVLAADVAATENVPPFDNTAVDGYAVRASDTASAPCELRVTGEMAAGAQHVASVETGTAVRIMTGAPLPDGCDAIVMVEDTERVGDDSVRINRSVSAGDGIRRAGSDVVRGEVPLRAGTVVTAAVQAVLSTVNARTVSVWPRPRVGVISTGDELVDDGSPLQPGQIRESNRTMLLRLVSEAGAEAVDLGIVRDDETELESALRTAVNNDGLDALVTSGGVSMGDYDIVKSVLSRIADMSWFQIAMKPAKPFAFGTLRNDNGVNVPVFGLPGNPVSSLVSFELIARPALEVMMHTADSMNGRRRVKGVIDHAVARQPDGKVHFDRCVASWGTDGRIHVARVAAQASHQLAATALANALVEIPDGDGVGAGDEVLVTLLGAGGHLPTTA
jgi:molybdenum cofactor synthesis domain-containing protein